MANPENLRPPWKKGQSGNPKGMKKGTIGLTSTLKNLLQSEGVLKVRNAKEIDDNGKETGNKFALAKIVIPQREMIILAALKKAVGGDMRAVEWMSDRTEGRATQPIQQVTELAEGDYDISKLNPDEQRLYLDLLRKMKKPTNGHINLIE